MAFPIEEGLKQIYRDPNFAAADIVFVAFPIEEGLKLINTMYGMILRYVFVAFPIEEGLKPRRVYGGD